MVYWTLTRRELGGYFLSITGYVIIAAAALLMGLSFVILVLKLQGIPMTIPVTELFYMTQFFWLILLLATPVITMRLFALERFSGTFETLMTTPVSDLQVVLSKFTSAMAFYMFMWLPLLGCILSVRYFTGDVGALDVGSVCSTYLAILLLGGVFISGGCWASALTRNQAVAAMISLLFGASLFLLAFLAGQLPNEAGWEGQTLATLALFDHMHDFARGVVDTRPVVLMVSLTLFFLFLPLRLIESRRWK